MRKLGWYALRVTVAVFVLCGGLLLAANLYVQSRSVQQRIRAELAASLKVPVSLQKTTVTPWDGVRLDGIVLHADGEAQPPDGESATDFLRVASFRVRFAWWPLLTQKRLVIEQILMDGPLLTLRDGFNPLAGREPELAGEDESRATPPMASQAASPPPTPLSGEPPPDGAEPPVVARSDEATPEDNTQRPILVKDLPFLVDKLRLRHGKVIYLDRDRRPLARIDDINLDGSITDPQHAHGALWFAKAGGEHSGATLTNYWTAVDFDNEKGLAVRDGHGGVAGGVLNTDFRLEPQDDRLVFSTNAKLENVALGQLTRDSANHPPVAEGQLQCNLDMHGFADDPASREGGGRLWLVGAKLRDLPLLKIVGQMLRIADLSHLEFKQAEMDYKLEGTTVRVDPLTLVANDVQVIIRGNYLTDERRLDLHGRLTIDQAVSHQLPQFIESNFTLCGNDAPGSRYLDFDITGSSDDPQCNLYDRLVAGPMKGLLDNLLAPKSKNPKNQRRDNSKKARPIPEVTPKP